MGGIFSGHTDFEHACVLIDPKDDTRVRPTDNLDQRYVERWADIDFSLEHHSTYTAFALQLVRGFDHDSLDKYDPEFAYRHPKKKKERVIGQYTSLGNLIANPGIVFVCYMFKKDVKNGERKELRKLVRQNSREDVTVLERRNSAERRHSSETSIRTQLSSVVPQTTPIPPKKKRTGSLSEN